ncbi:hypothetical protein [Shimia biformata]|uniref:hypothetical protein n=1 Tax=Shimia biformata TaxID=1294299 RepID=UPI00194DED4D|nr:hypothetical protein [Shimia biformata]
MNLPAPLGLQVLAEIAWVGCSNFEPHRWSALSWKLIEAGYATATISQLANEAETMWPTAFEDAVRRGIDEIGMTRIRDHEEADLIWKACRILPALGSPALLDERVRSLVAKPLRTQGNMDLLVGLGTLFEQMNLGPDDLDPDNVPDEGFVSDYCRLWADRNSAAIRPHFDAAKRIFG